jgi:excisionase family DNA binding protein
MTKGNSRSSATFGAQRQYIRQEVAAERWDVSVDTIRRLIAAGKITGYRLNGRIIRVDVAEVDACFREIPTVGGAA